MAAGFHFLLPIGSPRSRLSDSFKFSGRSQMRLTTLVLSVLAMLSSGAAHAQAWIEFEDRVWGVSINFPHEPVAEDIEYTTYYDRIVPARVYTAQQGSGRYSLTAVNFASDPSDSLTAVSHAAEAIRAKGESTYYGFHDLDGIPGIVISVTDPEGRLIQASVYFVAQRLYIAEGSVAAGNPPPSNFQQTISILGPSGSRIILDRDLVFP